MGPYDNPSADKFGPPTGSSDPQPTPTGPKAVSGLALVALVLIALKFFVPMFEGKSLAGIAIYLGLLWAAAWVKGKSNQEKGHDPYRSDQHVTR